MVRARFLFSFTALAILAACGDDEPTPGTNRLAFEGVAWVAPDDAGRLVATWKPAPDAVDYRIYVSRIQGRQLKTTPMHSNTTSVVITPEVPGERYYVTVRAADVRSVEDANVVEKSALATADTSPPTFGGPSAVNPTGNAGASVSWEPASDDLSPPEAIVYDVYAGRARNDLKLVATTAPGDTSIELSRLGQPSETFFFKVTARDIANNASPDGNVVTAALGQDATPPTFDGCDTATNIGATGARVTWKRGADNHSAQSALTYEVFASTVAGQQDAAPLVKVGDVTEATVTGLQPGTTYHFRCHARDAAGNLDVNTVERPVTLPSDVSKPTFGGITFFDFKADEREVELRWAPAKDDRTAAANIVYDVFESRTPGTYDFDAPPRATSVPGATSIIIKDIATRSTLYWVVRARDESGNRDDGLIVERHATTATSYAIDVQGVFNRNCAVIGCHVTGPQAAGLNLSPTFSYEPLKASSNLNRPMPRVTPGDLENSFLYIKVKGPPPAGKGLQMPAPQTGNALSVNDLEIIRSWILEGARNN